MGTVLRRNLTPGNLGVLQPGEYRKLVGNPLHHAVVICPCCERSFLISRAVHKVAPGGEVSPSVVCAHAAADDRPCSFHEYVTLGSWGD